jgi:hypothetical protein
MVFSTFSDPAVSVNNLTGPGRQPATTKSLKEEHSGPVVDGGQRRVLDCGMERVPTG